MSWQMSILKPSTLWVCLVSVSHSCFVEIRVHPLMTVSADYFRNLYFSNGTFLVLTTNPSSFPEQGADYIFSGLARLDDPSRKRPPAGEDRFAIMTPKEAMDRGLLQPAAIRKEGISVSQMMRIECNESSFR